MRAFGDQLGCLATVTTCVALALATSACASSNTETGGFCDCRTPGFFVDLSETRPIPKAEGVCHVVVELDEGSPSYAADVTVVHLAAGTCCDGFFPQADDTIVVPEQAAPDPGLETG